MRVASLSARLDRSRAKGILEGFETSRTPAIVLDQTGRVSAITAAAAALFDGGFCVRDRRLRAADTDDAATLDAVAARACSSLVHAPLRSFLGHGRGHPRPVQIQASLTTGPGESGGARLLFVLTHIGAQDRVLAEDLMRLFELTGAETDVVVQFTEDAGIPEIATRRRAAQSTVREQMKSINRKTDVSRQMDLIRLLARMRH